MCGKTSEASALSGYGGGKHTRFMEPGTNMLINNHMFCYKRVASWLMVSLYIGYLSTSPNVLSARHSTVDLYKLGCAI